MRPIRTFVLKSLSQHREVSACTFQTLCGNRRFRAHKAKRARSHWFPRTFLLMLLGTLPGPLSSFAQSVPDTGIPPFGTFNRDSIDTINLGNLNVHFQFPVFAKKGRGIDFAANLVHDNSGALAWTPGSAAVWHPYLSDWSLETPTGGSTHSRFQNTSCDGGKTNSNIHYDFYYTDPTHTRHSWPDLYVDRAGVCYANSGSAESTDGWALSVSFSGSTLLWIITDTQGDVIHLSDTSSSSSVTDPNGNQIVTSGRSCSGNPPVCTFNTTDTTGFVALTTQTTGGSPLSSASYAYPNPSGGAESVVVTYSAFTFKTQFACPSISDSTGSSYSLPTQISLPDGTSYVIVYESLTGTYPSTVTTGRIHSLTLPSGAVVTYTYSGGTNGINCLDGSPAILTTQTPAGTWTYNHSWNSTTGVWTTIVTDPSNNDSVYTFGGGATDTLNVEFQRLTYQGSHTSGTLLESRVTCYNGKFYSNNLTGCATPLGSDQPSSFFPITRKDVYTTPAGGTTSLSETFYDNFERVTQTNDFDYGVNTSSAPSGIPVRSTLISYANIGNNTLGHPACAQVSGGTSPSTCGTITSTTKSLTNYLNYDSHGNVGTIQNWVSGSTYVSQNFTYYSTGLVDIATDVNGAQTMYTYGACNNSYPTLINEALSLSQSMTWDCNGGLVTSVTDENNQKTSYSYASDPFWRVTSITDPLNNVTTLAYTPSTSESTLSFNGGSSTEDNLETVDSLGRAKTEQKRQAPGSSNFDTVSYSYDASGRLATVSLPCVSTAGTGCGTGNTSTHYDALGRPTSATDAGGGTVSYSYPNNDVLVTIGPAPSGEHAKQRQLEYDALGRLTSVCEVTALAGSGSCGQNTSASGYLTKYTYDALGNLLTVTQNAQPNGTPQPRNYRYDAMSRLTSETNPESGTTSYTYDSDSTCGSSSGDLVKRIDANGNVTCYQYDGLHRVTSITYPSGPNAAATSAKTFLYDATSFSCPTGANVKGRLADVYTGPSTAKITDLAYCYSPRGEVTDFYTATQSFSGYNHITKTYWANGLLQQLSGVPGLPTVYYGASDGSGLDGEGRITKILAASGPNPIACSTSPCVSYNAAGQVTNLIFGSGDSDSYTYDPNTGRMTQYNFTVNGQSAVGNPSWNANGTLAGLNTTDPFNSGANQNCTYANDDLARLTNVNCPGVWAQTFTYDAFGNISKSGSSWWQPGYSTATNRYTLAGTSYDNNGNLLSDTFHTYQYDADGNIVALDVGGSNYTDYLTYDAFGNRAEYNHTYPNSNPGWLLQAVYGVQGRAHLMLGWTFNVLSGTGAEIPLVGGARMRMWNVGTPPAPTYKHSDWLGSIRLDSTPSRTVVSDRVFAPFGEVYNSPTKNGWDEFAGLSTYLASTVFDADARTYEATQGRWLRPDPAGLAAVDPTNPQSWNRYSYVLNNPLTNIDPDGLDCLYGSNVEGAEPLGNGVYVLRGDCASESDNGLYVNGTVNTGSTDSTGDLTYTFDPANCATATICTGEGTQTGFANWDWPSQDSDTLTPGQVAILGDVYKRGRIVSDASEWAACTAVGGLLGTPPSIEQPLAHIAIEGAAKGLENPKTATAAARAFHTATDARFTAGGKFSKALVPRTAKALSPALHVAGKAVSVAGWTLLAYDTYEAGKNCASQIK